jgi:N-acetylmuramoyl-L-alanine amidase
MKVRMGRALSLLVLTVSLLVTLPALAEGRSVYASIRSEYVRLRNVDPTGDTSAQQSSWEALSRRLDSAIATHGEGADTFRYRIYAADVHLRLWRHTRSDRHIEAAARCLEPVLRIQGASADAYDALLLRGDIALSAEGAPERARSFYERALKAATQGGLRARERLQGIRNDTFSRFVPSPDMEIPRPLPRRFARKRAAARTVVIDPGHGGDDPGAVGFKGVPEKEITLDIARRVESILSGSYGIRVVLTRRDDTFTPLARRTAYANRRNADAFVSLHLNATPSHTLSGLETYYLDNTDDAASRKLAERENALGEGESLDDLSFILSDLIQSGKLEDSVRLSRILDGAVLQKIAGSYPRGRSLGVKKAPFFVLVGAHMPCSLIELFFIDHPADGAKLVDERFRQLLAEGIANGIRRFLDDNQRVVLR